MTKKTEKPTITAALLDAEGYFLRMDSVAELTPLHLPEITECDLPPREYQWDADKRHFVRARADGKAPAPDFTRAVALALAEVGKTIALPAETQRFLRAYAATADAKGA
jgi:hypothetical protein